MSIQVGKRWIAATVRVITLGEVIHVYHGEDLIRTRVPDRTKRAQPLAPRHPHPTGPSAAIAPPNR